LEELGPLFVPPSEPDRLWILIALLVVIVVAAGVVVVIRGRLPDSLGYAGLLMLPIFGYVLGDLHVLEESKRVEFCGSCHQTMMPLVEDMRGGDEGHLAAIHYQRGAVPHDSACYRCHSGYGIWGGTRAKTSGLMHMLHTVTGNYEYPLRKKGTFDISACLDCHAEALPFRAAEAHRDPSLQQALLSGELSCAGLCHPAPHADAALMGLAAWEASR
jgi:hypothetical protein